LENWKEQGGKTMKEKLDEKVRDILANHVPKPLSPEIIKELRTR
jgi:trimethylamine:corrinoid methyltransferase-like protein